MWGGLTFDRIPPSEQETGLAELGWGRRVRDTWAFTSESGALAFPGSPLRWGARLLPGGVPQHLDMAATWGRGGKRETHVISPDVVQSHPLWHHPL